MTKPRWPKTYHAAIRKFERENDWLTEADTLAMTSLRALAEIIDAQIAADKPQASMIAQFNLQQSRLLTRAPKPAAASQVSTAAGAAERTEDDEAEDGMF